MNLENLINKLEAYKKELENFDIVYSRPNFINKISELRKFLANINDEDLINSFLNSPYCKANKDFFRTQNNYYMRAIETQEALGILTKQYNGNDFGKILEIEQIKERYKNKGKNFKNIDFSK